jgi:hypothetical protein
MIKKPAIIVGEIDYKAGQEIENGNKRFAGKDREYRTQLKKVVDHGMDL